jgi:hypothetical protein
MPPLLVALLLLFTPVLSEEDLRAVEALASGVGVGKGASESLSTDVTGDGVPDVVLVRRSGGTLTLFIVEGPVSARARWWRLDLRRGAARGDLCVPPRSARVELEDAAPLVAQLGCGPHERGEHCALLGQVNASSTAVRGRGLRISGGECDPVHVFFDGSDLRYWTR